LILLTEFESTGHNLAIDFKIGLLGTSILGGFDKDKLFSGQSNAHHKFATKNNRIQIPQLAQKPNNLISKYRTLISIESCKNEIIEQFEIPLKLKTQRFFHRFHEFWEKIIKFMRFQHLFCRLESFWWFQTVH
jgi:hypothetical protein